MNWLKDVIVDIIVTVTIIAAVLVNHPILTGIVWAYTGLLLLVKTMVLAGGGFMDMMSKARTEAPKWFSHLLYGINTGALLYFQWWYAAGGWAIIWLFSYLTQRKLDQAK